jgi:hypothetical protein
MESLPEDRIEIVQRIGQAVVDLFQVGAIEDAYTYLYVENKDAGRIDNDEFVAIWGMLKPYSKERAAIKRLRDEAMTVQATTPEPADA